MQSGVLLLRHIAVICLLISLTCRILSWFALPYFHVTSSARSDTGADLGPTTSLEVMWPELKKHEHNHSLETVHYSSRWLADIEAFFAQLNGVLNVKALIMETPVQGVCRVLNLIQDLYWSGWVPSNTSREWKVLIRKLLFVGNVQAEDLLMRFVKHQGFLKRRLVLAFEKPASKKWIRRFKKWNMKKIPRSTVRFVFDEYVEFDDALYRRAQGNCTIIASAYFCEKMAVCPTLVSEANVWRPCIFEAEFKKYARRFSQECAHWKLYGMSQGFPVTLTAKLVRALGRTVNVKEFESALKLHEFLLTTSFERKICLIQTRSHCFIVERICKGKICLIDPLDPLGTVFAYPAGPYQVLYADHTTQPLPNDMRGGSTFEDYYDLDDEGVVPSFMDMMTNILDSAGAAVDTDHVPQADDASPSEVQHASSDIADGEADATNSPPSTAEVLVNGAYSNEALGEIHDDTPSLSSIVQSDNQRRRQRMVSESQFAKRQRESKDRIEALPGLALSYRSGRRIDSEKHEMKQQEEDDLIDDVNREEEFASVDQWLSTLASERQMETPFTTMPSGASITQGLDKLKKECRSCGYFCLVCDQHHFASTLVPFNANETLWRNVVKWTRVPDEVTSRDLIEQYDVSGLTGINELKNCVLSPEAVRSSSWRDRGQSSAEDPGSPALRHVDESHEDIGQSGVQEHRDSEVKDVFTADQDSGSPAVAPLSPSATTLPPLALPFCKTCHDHLTRALVEAPPPCALVDYRFYGHLSRDVMEHLNSALKFAVSKCTANMSLRTWHRGGDGDQNLIGNVSIVESDDGLRMNKVINLVHFKTQSPLINILVDKSLSDTQKKFIVDKENLVMSDYRRFREEITKLNPSVGLPSDQEVASLGLGEVVEIAEVFDDVAMPPNITSVVGETIPTGPSDPVINYRYCMQPSSAHSPGVDNMAIDKLKIDLPATVPGLIATPQIIAKPSRVYAALESENTFPDLFPYLFPAGFGLINPRRKTPSSLLKEIRLCLNGSGAFQKEFEFVAVAFAWLKERQIWNSLQFRVSTMGNGQLNKIITATSEEVYRELYLRSTPGGPRSNSSAGAKVLNPAAFALGSAHGSDGERLKIRNETFSLFDTIGSPTWFITISPSAENNESLYNVLKPCITIQDLGSTDTPTELIPSKEQCLREVRNNPAGCVRYFERLQCLIIEDFLGWDTKTQQSKPGGGALGVVSGFKSVFETNARGFLHVHMLVCMRDAPSSRTHFRALRAADPGKFDKMIFDYINKTVTHSYDLSVDRARCPHCKKRGTFDPASFVQPRAAYATDQAKFKLDEPRSLKCGGCAHESSSGDIIRNTALQILFPETVGFVDLEQARTLTRRMIFAGSESFQNVPETEDPQEWAKHALLLNLFQEHSWRHTTTCFKNDSHVCRMRYPRLLVPNNVQSVCTGETVEVPREAFSEWLNASLLNGMDTFRCNQDATFLCTGSRLRNLFAYIAKYIAKAQGSPTKLSLQLAARQYAAKKQKDEAAGINRGSGSSNPPSESRDADAKVALGILRSLVWSLSRCDEIEPQLMIYHLLHGSPSKSSHSSKTINMGPFMALARGEQEPDVALSHDAGSKTWVQVMDPTKDYLHRPVADENMSMSHFGMTRLHPGRRAPPKSKAHRFTQGHPEENLTGVVPGRQILVPYPPRRNIADLRLKRNKYTRHRAGGPIKPGTHGEGDCPYCGGVQKKADLAYQGITLYEAHAPEEHTQVTSTEASVADVEFQEDHDSLEFVDCVDSFDSTCVEERPDSPSVADVVDGDGVPPDESRFNMDLNCPDTALEEWGMWTCLYFGTYRNIDDLRICPKETWFDAANRLLSSIKKALPKGAPYGPMKQEDMSALNLRLCHLWMMHIQINERQRSTDDYAADRDAKLLRESEPLRDMKTLPIGNGNRHESDEELDLDVLEIVDGIELDDRLQQREKLANVGTVQDLLEGECLRNVPFNQPKSFAKSDFLQRINALIKGAAQTVSLADNTVVLNNEFNAAVARHRGLEWVNDHFKLRYEQSVYFFFQGSRLFQQLRPDLPSQRVPWKSNVHESKEQNLMIIPGQGGTGKSTVIQALKFLTASLGAPQATRIVAYIGVAAVNAGGTTIHSSVKLRPNGGRRTEVSQELKQSWKPVRVLFMDEYGTCGRRLFARFEESGRLVKGNLDKPFGGLDVVLTGDHFQFEPPLDQSLWSDRLSEYKANLTRAADDVFNQFTSVIYLQHNFRSEKDPIYCQFLLNLRSPQFYEDMDAMNKAVAMLNTRRMDGGRKPSFDSSSLPVVLVPTNEMRRAETERAKDIAIAANVPIYVWGCTPKNPHEIPTDLEKRVLEEYSWQTSNSMKAPPTFFAWIGMPCSITVNPSEDHQRIGIATGAYGVIQEIVFHPDVTFDNKDGLQYASHIPAYLVVKFESPAEVTLEGFPAKCRPILPIQTSGTAVLTKGVRTKVKFNYSAFPLRHRFATTYHAAQGLTMHNVIFLDPCSNRGVGASKMLYLVASRAPSLKNIRIAGEYTINDILRSRPSAHDFKVEEKLQKRSKLFLRSLNLTKDILAKSGNIEIEGEEEVVDGEEEVVEGEEEVVDDDASQHPQALQTPDSQPLAQTTEPADETINDLDIAGIFSTLDADQTADPVPELQSQEFDWNDFDSIVNGTIEHPETELQMADAAFPQEDELNHSATTENPHLMAGEDEHDMMDVEDGQEFDLNDFDSIVNGNIEHPETGLEMADAAFHNATADEHDMMDVEQEHMVFTPSWVNSFLD